MRGIMKETGIFASKEDTKKLLRLTTDAKKACHQLALDYGLPEIEGKGYYGITIEGEFVSV